MENTLVKSTLILSIATLIIRVLGSIFKIPLQNIAGDEVLGIFSLVYPVYLIALNLSVAGIPVAISKLISEANVMQDRLEVGRIYRTSQVLTLLFGMTMFIVIVSFSEPISSLLGGQSVRLSLVIVSTTLLLAPYMAVYRGYFQGFENMNPTAVSQVIEQFIRIVLILIIAVFLVKQNYSEEIISGGIMVSSFIGALTSFVYLRRLYSKSSIKIEKNHSLSLADFLTTSKKILSISIPICIGAIAMSLNNVVDSFTIPTSLIWFGASEGEVHYLYGIFSRGLALVQIATVFSSSIVLPLIPAISKSIIDRDFLKVRSTVKRTHYYTHLLSWPIALGMAALTLPINFALFKDFQGSDVLAVISISTVFTSYSLIGTGILQGINKAGLAARIIISSVLLKIVLNMLLVSWFGLVGAALSTLIVYIFVFILNTYYIWKITHFTIWDKRIFSIFISSIIMGLVIGIPLLYIDIMDLGRVLTFCYILLSITIGAVVYFMLIYLTKGVDKEELSKFPFIKRWIRK